MTIYVVSHKHLDLPLPPSYQAIFAGAANCPSNDRGHSNWIYDDSGNENISSKNSSFCELTALHWIWKNSNESATGLLHYRRYAANPETGLPLSRENIDNILKTKDAIVAQRSYLFSQHDRCLCSVAEQYREIHSSTDLVIAEAIIKKHFKTYHPAFKKCIARNFLFPCNIIICNKKLFNSYCLWLFSVISKLEQYIDPHKYRDSYQSRVFGFLAERLLNVYIEAHSLDVFETPLFDPTDGIINPLYTLESKNLRPILTLLKPKSSPVWCGKNYSRVFDYKFYLEHNIDLTFDAIPDQTTALWHFVEHGIPECRMAHPRFSITSYIAGHPELKARYGQDPRLFLEHYLDHPKDKAHRVGFENLTISDIDQQDKKRGEWRTNERTCLGEKISPRLIEYRFLRAETMSVLG